MHFLLLLTFDQDKLIWFSRSSSKNASYNGILSVSHLFAYLTTEYQPVIPLEIGLVLCKHLVIEFNRWSLSGFKQNGRLCLYK